MVSVTPLMQPLISNFSGRAIAADECGAPAGANDTITCNNTTYTTGPGDSVEYVGVDGLTLIIDDGGTGTLDVTTAGAAVVLRNNGPSTNDIVLQATSFGTISTTSNNAAAIAGVNGLGTATVTLSGGQVSTSGTLAQGLLVQSLTGAANLLMSGGAVSTTGNNAIGLSSLRQVSTGSENSTVTLSGGSVTTSGSGSNGVQSATLGTSNMGTAIINMSGGTVSVLASGYGLSSFTDGLGDVEVNLSGGSVATAGVASYGIYAHVFSLTGPGDTTITIDGGSVATTGAGSHAALTYTRGTGNAIIDMANGDVGASGAGSHGLNAESIYGGFSVSVEDGTVSSGTGAGAAIYTFGPLGGTADIGSAAVIDGSESGLALVDADTDSEGFGLTSGGNITVTSAGMVTGDGILNLGDDSLTISGGSWAGDLYGDGMTVDAADGDDTFTYSGGILAGNTYASGGNDMLTASGSAVTGDAALGLGNDSATLSGGSWTGNIYGDGMTADAADGADTFTWSAGGFAGGYYAGGGNDTATVSSSGYNGSQIFSGDDAAGTLAASTYDAITFSGVNAATDAGATIVYWDDVTLESSALSVTSAAWDISTAPGQGLFLNNSTLAWSAPTGNLNANLDIGAGSTASFGGTSLLVAGNLANNGLLTMQDGAARSNVVVLGNYAGTGTLAVDVDFATNTADVLTVNGDVTGGPTLLSINNATSGYATGNDVLVVDVAGASAAGDFALSGGPIGSGAYLYDLFFAAGDFYIGTDGTYQPAVPVYEAYPQMLMALGRLPTLRQRIGERDVYDGNAGRVTDEGANLDALWGRIDVTQDHFEPKSSTTSYETDFAHWALNLGVDGLFSDGENGQLVGGFYAKYLNGFADTTSAFGNGKTSVDGYGLGATLTWYGDNGFYADGQAQFQWYDSDLKSDTLGTLADGNQGSGFSTSIEIGKSFALSDRASLTPQAQLTYAMISFDDFNSAAYGENVSLGNNDSLRLRLGLSTDEKVVWQDDAGKTRSAGFYTIANVHYDFLEGTSVDISGVSLNSDLQGLYGEAGIGGTYSWADGKYAAYGEISGLAGFGDTQGNYSIAGKAGMMVRW
ncbi:autotransporter outer membrane beta-barrel domain-containing protein [Martelella sp. FOR1707]